MSEFEPWTAFPSARPCTERAPDEVQARFGVVAGIVCTRPKDHDGDHACGVDGKVRWRSGE